ncbi:McrB family protein [Pseudobacter ginsenosidimutans]|uniref:5-methylcytosine-specific restriction protein B n=1 Tax=Pseudobacter ginsenosidimutans TaxID=661488 RepID=A0A4Q7N4Q5_9BACT|nr:AAA family ATPase [Pseudobacter ginsenosidimutans]QEC44521.1 hypothetical protein FSB84_23630 [Pseudobacter ginsenosidimutans]RZS75995.1 5-methylcytosine-specific restriction protein B [Pseudobacter ginsenosidimutans]
MPKIERDQLDLIIKNEQAIIKSEDFYFQKGTDALRSWIEMDVPEELIQRISRLSDNYQQFKEEAAVDKDIQNLFNLLLEITSYCDSKAKEKSNRNLYPDKRVLARANVRMNAWIKHLILFKFSRMDNNSGSTLNAFKYLLDPENNLTILSEGHRNLIARNLLGMDYNPENFVKDIKSFFEEFQLSITNPINYTHLLSRIIYSITDKWQEEVIALMASDSTMWQDEHIESFSDDFDASIVWNSKRPSGGAETIEFLTKIIDENRSFNLYYSSGGYVNYKATVIDFATNQEELDKKNWEDQLRIMGYSPRFEEYEDGKTARIIFLVSEFDKIIPLPITDFKLYSDYDYPRHDNLAPLKAEPETEKISLSNQLTTPNHLNLVMPPLNQILFGPPGTGKTYHTVNRALEAIDENIAGKERKEIRKIFDKKVQEGQIIFTTFHQSMSYEDFVEGLKPIAPKQEGMGVGYGIEDGIFKTIAARAKANNEYSLLNASHDIKPSFDIVFERLKREIEDSLTASTESEINAIEQPSNEKREGLEIKLTTSFFSITGINGSSIRMMTRTGNRDLSMTKSTLQRIYEAPQILSQIITGGMRTYYKALVEQMKKWESEIKEEAQKVVPQKYVLIIDEINRGNISEIFGELITLIEEDKRLGAKDALEVLLPYSKETFGVPNNLYIIGTMNTADRSAEALDTALRRRFSFEEMPPRPELIIDDKKLPAFIGSVNLQKLLSTINNRIEKLLDKDHLIGHSYLIFDHANMNVLESVFYNKIIPLLQEYFFSSYEKIGLVLGDGFVRAKNVKIDNNIFADFDSDIASEFDDKVLYEIIDFRNPDHFYEINKIRMTFEKALNRLMKENFD